MSSLSSTPPPLRPSVVLIAGATGRQGSSIIRALLAHPTPPTKIFALTRTPTSPAGLALAALSPKITLLRGSPTSLPPLAGLNLTAAYLVTEYKSSGPAGELNQATSFLSALVDAKVPHVVVSTVAAPRGSGVAHFESKLDIEEMVRKNGVINGTSWTFLKPVAFMENFPKTSGAATFAGLGLFEAALKGKRIQMVSVEDIGYFGARALLDPATYSGRGIELAGDDLSISELQDAYQKHQGGSRPWRAYVPSILLGCLPASMRGLLNYMAKGGDYRVDIGALRAEYPGLLTFEKWLDC